MASLASLRVRVNKGIETALEKGDFGPPNRLRDGCAYVMRGGGKRWRPILALSLGAPLDAALAIECIHTASLIVDDLPMFDNDSSRRGQAAIHVVFGEMIAQLVAVSLMGAAFRLLARAVKESELTDADSRGMLLVQIFADNIGAAGAAGGQFLDSWPNNLREKTTTPAIRDSVKQNPPPREELQKILHQKTATFFEMALVTGWVLGGRSPDRIQPMKTAAAHFGLAFQIADDLGDVEQDSVRVQATGLPSTNYILNFGVTEAMDMFIGETRGFINVMQTEGVLSPAAQEMASVLIDGVRNT